MSAGSFNSSLLISNCLASSSSTVSLNFCSGTSIIFGAVKTNKDFTAGAIDKEYDSFMARIEAFASACEVSDMLEYEGIIKSLSFRTKLIFPSINAFLFPR